MALRGFYGVVDEPASVAAARELAGWLVEGGACVVQLRLKRASTRAFVDLAAALAAALPVPLIVNDRLDVALAVGAAGVHLGQDDVPLAAARAAAGGRLLIGVSTHDVEQARAAARGGADYLGFGPVYPTTTKDHPDPVQGPAGLALAVQAAAGVPVVAIGGITPARAVEVAAAGAAAACAISSVNRAPDVVAAARTIAEAFAS